MFKKFNQKFLTLADKVSFGMGTPTNIFFWVLAVGVWFFLGQTNQELFAEGKFLPAWFTSNAWNFPLNTITTLAELYIGFLVAAATNRAERKLRQLLESMRASLEKIEKINTSQNQILELLIKYQEKELRKESQVLREIKSLEK